MQSVCLLQTEPLGFSLGNGHGGVYAEQPSKFQSPLSMADGRYKLHCLDKQSRNSEPAFSAREGRDGSSAKCPEAGSEPTIFFYSKINGVFNSLIFFLIQV